MAELRPQGLANPALQDRPPTKREREAAAGLTRGPSDDALVSGSATAQSTDGHPSSQERSRSTPEGEGERSTARGPFLETESTYDALPPPSYTD